MDIRPEDFLAQGMQGEIPGMQPGMGQPPGMPMPGMPPPVPLYSQEPTLPPVDNTMQGMPLLDVLQQVMGGEETEEEVTQDEETFVGKEMTDEEIVSFVNARKRESEQAKRPHKEVWEKNWDLYNQQYDFSDKEDWQSQQAPPRVFMMVEKASQTLVQGLLLPREWFQIEAFDENDQAKIDFVKRTLVYWLNNTNVDFIKKFEEVIKVGLLSQLLIFKIGWTVVKEQDVRPEGVFMIERGVPDIQLVDPFNIFLDTSGKNRWVIEQSNIPLPDYASVAKQNEYIKVEKVNAFGRTDEKVEEKQRRGEYNTPETGLGDVILDDYWGDIWDDEGEIRYKNIQATILNEKDVVLKPRANPYWHNENPFVIAGLINVPFSVYHKSIIGVCSGIIEMLTDILNLMYDGFLFSILKMYIADLDSLADPDEIDAGIFPGKIWTRQSGSNPQANPVTELYGGQINPQIFSMYQLVDREGQLGSGITDSMQGVGRMRGRVSALETAQKAAETNQLFSGISRSLENSFLSKMLRKLYLVILQFQKDYPDMDYAKTVFADVEEARKFLSISPEERYKELAGNFKFTVQGLTNLMAKKEDIEKATFVLKLFTKIPTIADKMNWNGIVRRLIEAIGWDAFEVLGAAPPQEPRTVLPQTTVAQQPPQTGQPAPNPIMDMLSQGGSLQGNAPPGNVLQNLGQGIA